MHCILLLFAILIYTDFSSGGDNDLSPIIKKLKQKQPLNWNDFDYLAHARLDELPVPLRRLVEDTPEGEHLCCRNTPVLMTTKSRLVLHKRLVASKTTDHNSCGFLNAGTCSSEKITYRMVNAYVREYYQTPVLGQCPDRHIVCCDMYIMVAEKCVHLHDLHETVLQIVG